MTTTKTLSKRTKRRSAAAGIHQPEAEPAATEPAGKALSHTKAAKKLRALLTLGKPTSLEWSVPAAKRESAVLKQAANWAGTDARLTTRKAVLRLDDWLDSLAHRGMGLTFALDCLAWVHLLPSLNGVLSRQHVNELVSQLHAIARDASGLDRDRQPVEHQLLTVEFPLLLSLVASAEPASETMLTAARTGLRDGIDALLDGDGMPHARDLPSLPLLMACWTRCVWLDRAMHLELLSGDVRLQYEWLVRQALRLTRHDGGQVLGPHENDGDSFSASLFETALQLAGDRADRAMSNCVLALGKRQSKQAAKSSDLIDAPEPSCYSEWAGVAVMRSSWKRPDEYLAAAFSGPELLADLSTNKGRLLLGEWETQIRVDDQPLRIDSPWSEVCWHSDDDVDYLELEQTWSHDWTLQRQLMIARQDRFVLIADAVVGEAAGQIEYHLSFPLAAGVRLETSSETNDAELHGKRPLATIFPLALPEWRSGSGTLAEVAGRLVLKQTCVGRRCYAPLVFDLASRRLGRDRTWRQLTVAERLEIQPADVAVGYRLQIGREQWLFYRSLARASNRTVLGHNLSNEFLCAQFDTEGEVAPLLQIDSE